MISFVAVDERSELEIIPIGEINISLGQQLKLDMGEAVSVIVISVHNH